MTGRINIPRCMSTQHPDNVHSPFFAESSEMGGEDEIQEAYYTFSHLACDEQMWDCEGKEVDNYVVKKLLTKYDSFFRDKRLGKDLFLTLRVPNPCVEKADAKILLETLESIPRSFDAARLFYGDDIPPIFEVILPMASSHQSLERIYRYYTDFVAGKQNKTIIKDDITIAEWIGKFRPERINVIPLFEEMEHMLNAHNITEAYIKNKNIKYQRVFLARSDPAVNYGLVSAVLLNKIALQRLHKLSADSGIPIYPILGVGSAPFRGNLRPDNIDNITREYPGTYTFTIQSAFKYDYQPDIVKDAIEKLKARTPMPQQEVDEEKCMDIILRYTKEYQKQVEVLAPIINRVARSVPSRRKRSLHIGLFGYSRSMGAITLPRAITFTAALYSIGLPPELLGLNALSKDDFAFLKEVYVNLEDTLKDSLKYFNPNARFLPGELKKTLDHLPFDFETDSEHREITGCIVDSLDGSRDKIQEYMLRAADLRKFLG